MDKAEYKNNLQQFPMKMNIYKENEDDNICSVQLSKNSFYNISKNFSFLLIEIMGQAAEKQINEEIGYKRKYLVAINDFVLFAEHIENLYETCSIAVKIVEKWRKMYKTSVSISNQDRIIAKCTFLHYC